MTTPQDPALFANLAAEIQDREMSRTKPITAEDQHEEITDLISSALRPLVGALERVTDAYDEHLNEGRAKNDDGEVSAPVVSAAVRQARTALATLREGQV